MQQLRICLLASCQVCRRSWKGSRYAWTQSCDRLRQWLVHGHNKHIGRPLSGTEIRVRCAGVEVDRVSRTERAMVFAVAQIELTFKHV